MGEIFLRGKDAPAAAKQMVTNALNIEDGQAQYLSHVQMRVELSDDLIVYRIFLKTYYFMSTHPTLKKTTV